MIDRSEDGLRRHEDRLLLRVANGTEVDVTAVRPRLVRVQPETENELLFRYLRLHWSIPVSAGYGRRLRFLVFDDHNDKVIGLIGLGDPVYGLGPRDEWIGWTREEKRKRLQCVMDAFVLGAVPPYSDLLCGKLVAMLVASDEIRRAFYRKYGGRSSRIAQERLDARLALVTTTSALGRSSVYNRVRFSGESLFISIGFTKGSGEFHFSNGLYGDLWKYATRWCVSTGKHEQWGDGFRNRREMIRRCLAKIGLSRELVYHGVQREIYVVPTASNSRAFLCGRDDRLQWRTASVEELFKSFRERWLLPRAERDQRYLSFERESYRLWPRRL
jgi:hypothetical protein